MYVTTSNQRRVSAVMLAIVFAVTVGCDRYGHDPVGPTSKSGISPSETFPADVSETPLEAGEKPEGAMLCHYSEEATGYVPIVIVGQAVDAHLRHGDGAVGDPVPQLPGMVFNDACQPVPANQILFDNGSSSGPQANFANMAGGQELFEDFAFTQNVRITKIKWQQHDYHQATYLSTEVLVFEGLPYDGPPIFSATVSATRVPNETGTLYDTWEGFDYEIAGLSIDLPPGVYWLGLNARFQGNRSGWDNTTGGANTIPGFRLINFNFPAPGLVSHGNLAFALYGFVR